MPTFFDAAPTSKASPILQALDELEVAYARRRLDLESGGARQAACRPPDPNRKALTLVGEDGPTSEASRAACLAPGPNRKALTLVEENGPPSEALGRLEDSTGGGHELWPSADSALRLEALCWTTWAYVSYRPPVSVRSQPTHCEDAEGELTALPRVPQGKLRGCEAPLREGFSLVDLAAACMVAWSRSRYVAGPRGRRAL